MFHVTGPGGPVTQGVCEGGERDEEDDAEIHEGCG